MTETLKCHLHGNLEGRRWQNFLTLENLPAWGGGGKSLMMVDNSPLLLPEV